MAEILTPLPTVAITGVELLMPGTYEGLHGGVNTYTADDLDGAVAAYQALKGVFTPKAKIGHNDKQALLAADELPSAGDFTNMYRSGDRLIVDVANVPAKLAQLIKAGAYGPRSAELLLNADFGTHGVWPLVVKGFAWLGATPPAVAGLSDIIALYSRPDEEPAYQGGTVVEIQLAAPTKTEGDAGDFTAAAYAYVPDPQKPSTWSLRLYKSPGDKAPDAGIVGAAAAALGPGFRGQKVDIPDADRSAVIARVRAAWKKANPDKKDTDMPKALQGEAKHSRNPFAALARLVAGAGTVADYVALADGEPDLTEELSDAQLAGQAIDLLNQLLAREASQIDSDDDEADDIRTLLQCRDMLRQFAAGEAAEGLGVRSSGGMGYYAKPESDDADGEQLMAALEAVKAHLDGMGKGKAGVGMARTAHRMLTGYAKAFMAQWQNPDDAGNTNADEGPEGETGKEQRGGVPVAHARQEDTVQDNELRALLGIAEDADIKQALLALKGHSVDLSEYEGIKQQVELMREREATREADLLVDRALTDHKINPAMRDWAVDMARNQRSAFEAYLSAAPATAWPAGELGRSGDAPGAPKPITPATASVAQVLGVNLSEITAAQETPLAQRVLEARQAALAQAGKSITKR